MGTPAKHIVDSTRTPPCGAADPTSWEGRQITPPQAPVSAVLIFVCEGCLQLSRAYEAITRIVYAILTI